MVSEGILFGVGNPLLDLQARVDKEFLTKWNLKEDDAILCDEKHVPMFKEMADKYEVEYVAGGATQNSMRVAQWIIGKPNAVTFSGCIGQDDYGKKLEENARSVGLHTIYQKIETDKTGTCACCIVGDNRSLCAHLAAANCFKKDHLDIPDHKALIEKADFFYIAGFVLTVSVDAMLHVANHASDQNKLFMTNLSAPFLSQFFQEQQMIVMPYVDILFGNESEAEAFAKQHEYGTTKIPEIALKLSQLPKANSKRPRIVVITQGSDPVVVATDGKVEEHAIIPLKKEQIVDTNGAGDAWVGGFLSQIVQGKDIADCIKCGNWAAHVIIQRSGCTFPATCEFKSS